MKGFISPTFLTGLILFNSIIVNAAPSYTFTDIGKGEEIHSVANSINNLNQIAGTQASTAVIWDGDSSSMLPAYPNQHTATIHTINNSGQILFSYSTPTESTSAVWSTNDNTVNYLPKNYFAGDMNDSGAILANSFGKSFLFDNYSASPVEITSPNGFFATSINNVGQIGGGAYFNGSVLQHAAIKQGDKFIDLGTLGGNNSFVEQISDNGYAIGQSQISNGEYRTFLWKDGEMDTLKYVPGAIGEIAALSVNNHGQSVGYVDFFTGQDRSPHAILWNGRNSIDLNDFLDADSKSAGWVLSVANDINDNGWIVGQAHNTMTDQNHAFLLSSDNAIPPIPEPSTYLMLFAGLGIMGLIAKKKGFIAT